MNNVWRFACPEGHRNVKSLRNGVSSRYERAVYRCRTCEETYDGEPIDLKHSGGAVNVER